MRPPIRLALIGIGKIARDQHLPAIAANPGLTLAAAVSRNAAVDGVPNFHDIDALVASGLELDAVSIATPPLGRHAIAAAALARGWHVMLEKPPGATLGEVRALLPGDRTLFTSWHSRHAAGVAPARAWLAGRRIVSVRIDWREDIRHWHPGQHWILAAGGLGVFDPGINALSIATAILPGRLHVEQARLDFPANRGAPIAASLALKHGETPVAVELDFLQTGPQSWDITVETDAGRLALHDGGARLTIDGAVQSLPDSGEYPGLYQHFADLIAAGRSDVDLTPLELVADAFLIGERREVAAFEF
ncbi:MAG: galactose 1-dehydrogenase [Alphaproteobacteria bacterium]|nr:MAG: galactose 1-dehydrogenase [Alphaproteobacteria bacterium]